MRNLLFSLVPDPALTEYLGVLGVETAHESQSEPFLPFREGECAIHHFSFLKVLVLDNLPGNSSDLLVHLQNELGSSTHWIFRLLADSPSPEALARDLQIASNVSLQVRIELLLIFIEEKHNNLGLPIFLDILVDFLLP